MKNWKTVKLEEVLKRQYDSVEINDNDKYKRLTIKTKGQGISLRNELQGVDIGTKNQFRVKSNQFLLSKIDAMNGAFGIIPIECDNGIITGNFWTYDFDETILNRDYLNFLCIGEIFTDFSIKASEGTTNRKYLREDKFLNLDFHLPPLAEQQRIVARLSALKNKIDEVKILRGEQEKDSKNLLYSLFLNTIKNAKWLKMGEVAPLVKRQVELQPNQFYNEIGARSFGKGTFDKPMVNSNDLTWQKPNWIKTGDLLFSNIKAWEGAIATVSEKDNNKIGSHRYLTFVPNPEIIITEFLCFYFLTHEGLDKVSDASPGSADRNRTLNTKKIFNALVPVPTLEAQQKFLLVQSQLNTTKQYQSEQMTLLNGIFPSLLNKAFRGEL